MLKMLSSAVCVKIITIAFVIVVQGVYKAPDTCPFSITLTQSSSHVKVSVQLVMNNLTTLIRMKAAQELRE